MREGIQRTNLSHDAKQGDLTQVRRFSTHIWSCDDLKPTCFTREDVIRNKIRTEHHGIASTFDSEGVCEFRTNYDQSNIAHNRTQVCYTCAICKGSKLQLAENEKRATISSIATASQTL